MNPSLALTSMLNDPVLARYLEPSLSPPAPFFGSGPVKLVILGQDPTVKSRKGRLEVQTVLNLDRPGSLRRYLKQLCEGLGLDINENVFATNYINVFFQDPPASIKELDLLGLAAEYWRPVLDGQLEPFREVPVLALGQPLLRQLVLPGASRAVRDYWGYQPGWKHRTQGAFTHLDPTVNRLKRPVFPFPHQPSSTKEFYASRRASYLAYMQETVFPPPA